MKFFLLLLNFSKVWNPATYEKAASLDAGPYIPDPGDVPMIDDRIPVSVKVVHATRFRGPPQYNVSWLNIFESFHEGRKKSKK